MNPLIMKNILISIILFFCVNILAHDQDEDYRYNPFQFKLPEYRFKADSESIDSIKNLPDGFKMVEFYGYIFFIPETFILQKDKGIPGTLVIRDKNNKGLLMLSIKPSAILVCDERSAEITKDYCSAFDTQRDYLVKTFTLIPEDLKKPEYMSIGYSWIVFYKGSTFEYVSDIQMYERENFIFFRQNLKPNTPLSKTKTSIMISSPKDDELLDITFLVKDEKLIMNIIKSFRLANE